MLKLHLAHLVSVLRMSACFVIHSRKNLAVYLTTLLAAQTSESNDTMQ
jgi:hypothetical protein